MTIDENVVGWLIGAGGVLFAALMWVRCRNLDCRTDAGAAAGLRVDLEYIKRGVDRISVDMQKLQEDMGEISVRLARVEESAKQAHKRIDGMDGTKKGV